MSVYYFVTVKFPENDHPRQGRNFVLQYEDDYSGRIHPQDRPKKGMDLMLGALHLEHTDFTIDLQQQICRALDMQGHRWGDHGKTRIKFFKSMAGAKGRINLQLKRCQHKPEEITIHAIDIEMGYRAFLNPCTDAEWSTTYKMNRKEKMTVLEKENEELKKRLDNCYKLINQLSSYQFPEDAYSRGIIIGVKAQLKDAENGNLTQNTTESNEQID